MVYIRFEARMKLMIQIYAYALAYFLLKAFEDCLIFNDLLDKYNDDFG